MAGAMSGVRRDGFAGRSLADLAHKVAPQLLDRSIEMCCRLVRPDRVKPRELLLQSVQSAYTRFQAGRSSLAMCHNVVPQLDNPPALEARVFSQCDRPDGKDLLADRPFPISFITYGKI